MSEDLFALLNEDELVRQGDEAIQEMLQLLLHEKQEEQHRRAQWLAILARRRRRRSG